MTKLIRMTRESSFPPPHSADVHPDEVEVYALHGWAREVDADPAQLVDQQFAGMTDEEIHEWCKERDLGPIHHKLKGDKLKARVAELIA